MDKRVYLKEIDAELHQCDALLCHAVARRYDLANRVVSPDKEYLLGRFITRLDDEIRDYSRRAGLLIAEREGLNQ